MSYTTAAKMLERYGAEVLTAIASATATSANVAKEVATAGSGGAAAAAAVAQVNRHITATARLMDDHLRSQYTLPLSQADMDASSLPAIAEALVRHSLDEAPTDKVVEDKNDALRQLRSLRDGRVRIATTSAAVAQHRARVSVPPDVKALHWGGY